MSEKGHAQAQCFSSISFAILGNRVGLVHLFDGPLTKNTSFTLVLVFVPCALLVPALCLYLCSFLCLYLCCACTCAHSCACTCYCARACTCHACAKCAYACACVVPIHMYRRPKHRHQKKKTSSFFLRLCRPGSHVLFLVLMLASYAMC